MSGNRARRLWRMAHNRPGRHWVMARVRANRHSRMAIVRDAGGVSPMMSRNSGGSMSWSIIKGPRGLDNDTHGLGWHPGWIDDRLMIVMNHAGDMIVRLHGMAGVMRSVVILYTKSIVKLTSGVQSFSQNAICPPGCHCCACSWTCKRVLRPLQTAQMPKQRELKHALPSS